eukprot:COSAG03_NODE_9818_length_691_cov_4.501689_2_plen_52_part_01
MNAHTFAADQSVVGRVGAQTRRACVGVKMKNGGDLGSETCTFVSGVLHPHPT